MEDKNSKLFIHGIFSSKITEITLKEYFSEYGEIIDAIVISHKSIGYITFSDPSMAQDAFQKDHIILGQKVEVKLAKPKVEKKLNKKIFVGGLPHGITYEEFTQYFEEYGKVSDAVVMYNNETGRSRGFGFITYDSEEAAKGVLQNYFHTLKNKRVEVKRVTPRDQMRSKSPEAESDSSITNSTHVSGSSIYNVYSQPYYNPSLSFGGGYYQNYQSWPWDHPLPCYNPYCAHPLPCYNPYCAYPLPCYNPYCAHPLPCYNPYCAHPYCNNRIYYE